MGSNFGKDKRLYFYMKRPYQLRGQSSLYSRGRVFLPDNGKGQLKRPLHEVNLSPSSSDEVNN